MDVAVRSNDAKALVALMVECLETPSSSSSTSSASSSLSSSSSVVDRLSQLNALLAQASVEVGRLLAQTAKKDAAKAAEAAKAASLSSSSFLSSSGGTTVTYLTVPEAQMLEPRGRFAAMLSTEGLMLEGKQASCFVPWTNVMQCACVPASASSKKEGEEVLALLLAEPVKCNNKDIKMLVWNLSKAPGKEYKATHEGAAGPFVGTEHHVVTALVGLSTGKTVTAPQRELFQSVAGQKPFLRCYKGTQEGAIYPLQSGLLFLRPALFLTTDTIASLSAGRGGSGGSTRYIDLVVRPTLSTPCTNKSHPLTPPSLRLKRPTARRTSSQTLSVTSCQRCRYTSKAT